MIPAIETVVSAAVEGSLDEAVASRLIRHVGAHPGTVYGKSGKQSLEAKITGYNNAARFTPWLVLVDLDRDSECAPEVRSKWLTRPSPKMCFRVAVRAVEAWLMADPGTLASFLSTAQSRIPMEPEELEYPKRAMVNLARRSRRSDIREDMVPHQGSGRTEGPAYTSRLIEYTTNHWRPEVALKRADSLRRAVDRLRHLTA